LNVFSEFHILLTLICLITFLSCLCVMRTFVLLTKRGWCKPCNQKLNHRSNHYFLQGHFSIHLIWHKIVGNIISRSLTDVQALYEKNWEFPRSISPCFFHIIPLYLAIKQLDIRNVLQFVHVKTSTIYFLIFFSIFAQRVAPYKLGEKQSPLYQYNLGKKKITLLVVINSY